MSPAPSPAPDSLYLSSYGNDLGASLLTEEYGNHKDLILLWHKNLFDLRVVAFLQLSAKNNFYIHISHSDVS